MVEIKKNITKRRRKSKMIGFKPSVLNEYSDFGKEFLEIFYMMSDLQNEFNRIVLEYRNITAGIEIYNKILDNINMMNKNIEDIKSFLLRNENLIIQEDFIVQEEEENKENLDIENQNFDEKIYA